MTLERKLMDALVYGKRKEIEKVFEEIYDQYYRLVYFHIRQYVQSKEDIEEMTNDVFVNFFNSLDRQKVIENIPSFLTKMARNLSIDFLRKNKMDIVEYEDKYEGTKDSFYVHDFIDDLQRFLSKEEFELLVEHLLVGKSLRLIAKEKQISPNTIKSVYRRMMQKIKKKMEGTYA